MWSDIEEFVTFSVMCHMQQSNATSIRPAEVNEVPVLVLSPATVTCTSDLGTFDWQDLHIVLHVAIGVCVCVCIH